MNKLKRFYYNYIDKWLTVWFYVTCLFLLFFLVVLALFSLFAGFSNFFNDSIFWRFIGMGYLCAFFAFCDIAIMTRSEM